MKAPEGPRVLRSGGAAPVLVCAVLATWAWAIAASNLPVRGLDAVRQRVGRADIALPDWRFYAPSPPDHDLALEYRTRDREGHVGPWLPLAMVPTRSWWRAVLSPGSRRAQAYKQVARHLLAAAPTTRPGGPEEQRLTRFVAALVAPVHPDPVGGHVCFRLLRTAAHDQSVRPRAVLISAWGRVQDGCA